MYEREKAVVKEWVDLMRGKAGDIYTGFQKLFDQNAKWTLIGTTPASGSHVGLEGIMKFLDLCFNGDGRSGSKDQGLDPDYGVRVTPREILAVEDGRILVLCNSEGRGKNGVPYLPQYAWVMRVKGDKIVEMEEYCDTANIETAMFNKKIVPAEKLLSDF